MERAVVAQLEDVKDRFANACWCERCRNDVLALALNSLPPVYVVSEEGKIYASTAALRQQYRADITVALIQAISKVQAHPRH
jgi:competence protein ComFB